MSKYVDFSVLKGLTLVKFHGQAGGDEILLHTACGRSFRLHHYQDCCEHVYVESIVGDPQDLIGVPLTLAEEVAGETGSGEYGEHYTWTFYKLATVRGYVDIRWLGSSNGYYGEGVDFEEITA